MHKKSILRELRSTAQAAASKHAESSEAQFEALSSHVDQFVELVYQAAEEGLWDIDLAFDSCTLDQLQQIAEGIKQELFDVMIIVDVGSKKITASWSL